jgi:hypothetical protein
MEEKPNQSDWNGVYYDRQSSEFFLMDVAEEEVTLVNAFTGADYETLSNAEFMDCARNGDFDEVSPEVVEAPANTAENLLYEAISAVNGGGTKWRTYFNPVDVDFAVTATNLSFDKNAEYRQQL